MAKPLDWHRLLVEVMSHSRRVSGYSGAFLVILAASCVGVAANAGVAFVGNVGSGTVLDFTALGDAVNVGARLQSFASPGEVVLSSELYDQIAPAHPGTRNELLQVKGRAERVRVAVLQVTEGVRRSSIAPGPS